MDGGGGGVCILSHVKTRFSWILTSDVSWSLGVQMLSLQEERRVQQSFQRMTTLGLPWWLTGKTPCFNAWGVGLIRGWGTEIPHAAQPKEKSDAYIILRSMKCVTNSIMSYRQFTCLNLKILYSIAKKFYW